jgi:tetratricopeptide (TPR) repeat protein
VEAGVSLELQGRFEEALAWYERAFEVDPLQDLVSGEIGYYHWCVLGELDQAVAWFKRAASLDIDYPYFPAQLGDVFLDLGDPGKAAYWIERSIEINPESAVSNNAMHLLHLYQRDEAAGLEYGRKSFAIGGIDDLQIAPPELLGDYEVRAARYSEARDLYAERYPELLREDDPKINAWNYRAAINLALVLYKTGEQERADLLLDRSLQHIETVPRLGQRGHGIADVKIYALRGEKQKALSALRQAIDEGWRSLWWYYLKYDPILESLHNEPEYQAIIAEIEADMAAQLARVREMEKNGELEPIPEVSATP